MPAVYELELIVPAAEIDPLGHVNNITYLKWMQRVALDHSAAQGWPHEAYVRLGAGWVVRSHSIEYLQPAYQGDIVVVRTWVATMKKATSRREYQIVRRSKDAAPEVLLAAAATEWAFVDFSTKLPRRIAPEVAEAFVVVERPPDGI